MKHYLILSEGAYSDYSPIYFSGSKEITQKEFDKKGEEVGDKLFAWFDTLPEREHKTGLYHNTHYSSCKPTEKYYPETGEMAYSGGLAEKWFKEMEKWILSQGFERLPEEIPEINVGYSDIPNSKNREE